MDWAWAVHHGPVAAVAHSLTGVRPDGAAAHRASPQGAWEQGEM
jgi:hypothetical protein